MGLCLYARTLDYEFVDWDDIVQVVENPWIRSLSIEHLAAIFSQPIVGSYFPLQSISFMLDYALWGLDPRGYHAQSVLLNALNAALAFWVLTQITRRPALAFIAALLWSVHHTHVEAVTWISARKEVLSTTLLLGSLGAYLHARRSAVLDRRAYTASVLLFGLGAAAKLTIGSYALFFLLVDRVLDARLAPEQRRPLLRHLLYKLPYIAVALPFALMNLRVQPIANFGVSNGLDYVLVRAHAAWRYLWLLLGLLPGRPVYDPPPISHDLDFVLVGLVPLIAPIVALAFALRRGHTNVALGLAWLIIGLLAPLAFPLVTYMADRYLYAPSLGFCWVLAAGIASVAFVGGRSPAWNGAVVSLLTAPLLLWFADHTWRYTPVWRNSESLWRRAVATSRDDRAAGALATELIRQQRFAEAERVLAEATVLGSVGYLNLAFLHHRENRYEDALRATDRAIETMRVQPLIPRESAKLMYIRGSALAQLHRPAEAVEAWKAALDLDPDNSQARAALDRAEREGRAGAAVKPAP